MTTKRKDYGPFKVTTKTIEALLVHGKALLTCEVQKGITPMGRAYKMRPQWWIKYIGGSCAMGPWTADGIRKHFTTLAN